MRFTVTVSVVLATIATIATAAPIANAASGVEREANASKSMIMRSNVYLPDDNKRDGTEYELDSAPINKRDIISLPDDSKRDGTEYELDSAPNTKRAGVQFGDKGRGIY